MANSRLLQMYGFAEAGNPHDDVHVQKDTIINVMKSNNVDAVDAKIKLLDSLGFFDEGKFDFFITISLYRLSLILR